MTPAAAIAKAKGQPAALEWLQDQTTAIPTKRASSSSRSKP